jgi:cytochrome c553
VSTTCETRYLREALFFLVQDAPIKFRLALVANYLNQRVHDHLDDEPELAEIVKRLRKIKAGSGDDGDIDATVKRLSDDDAREIAQDIVRVAFEKMEHD